MTGFGSGPLAVIAEWEVPHAAAAVVGPDGVRAVFGDPAEQFALASVTKPLSALTALLAVEEGALALDDPAVTDIVDGATVRHLLAHAAGLAMDRRVRAAMPGTRRIYSNAGIEILGEVVTEASGIDFGEYFAAGVAEPLGLIGTDLGPRPSRDGRSTVADLSTVIGELLAPTGLLHPSTVAEATSVQFPGLAGVVPGFGRQDPNDWGLGVEIKGAKTPHWTGASNSPATYGHFGQAGTMFWVDPVARLGLVVLTDRPFEQWARIAWPSLSDAVLAAYA
ncbi:MAG: serine hydrolase domain-containing protein [bacterium]